MEKPLLSRKDPSRALNAAERVSEVLEILKSESQNATELRQSIQLLDQAVQNRLRIVEVLRQIRQRANSGTSYTEILDFVFESLRAVLPYDRMGIALLEEQDKVLVLKWVKSRVAISHLGLGSVF